MEPEGSLPCSQKPATGPSSSSSSSSYNNNNNNNKGKFDPVID
jgi:hypothetical protein